MEITEGNSTLMKMLATGAFTVAVLTVIFGPLITSRAIPARVVTCAGNEKQMGLCLLMYAEDYDGRLPRASEWMDMTLPYVKNKGVFRCPERIPSQPTDFGYAFNASLSMQMLPAVKSPDKAVMFYDATNLRWNFNAPGRTGVANPPRHKGGDYFGFADGHVKWQSLTPGGN